jgi:hypothetical protein
LNYLQLEEYNHDSRVVQKRRKIDNLQLINHTCRARGRAMQKSNWQKQVACCLPPHGPTPSLQLAAMITTQMHDDEADRVGEE